MEEKVISEEEIVDMADFFKVFGDPTRLRILFVLWENEECNVGTISEKVKMSQSAVSQQLKILRSSRLVKFRKDGRSILYRLSDEHITKILQLGLEHYDELLGCEFFISISLFIGSPTTVVQSPWIYSTSLHPFFCNLYPPAAPCHSPRAM